MRRTLVEATSFSGRTMQRYLQRRRKLREASDDGDGDYRKHCLDAIHRLLADEEMDDLERDEKIKAIMKLINPKDEEEETQTTEGVHFRRTHKAQALVAAVRGADQGRLHARALCEEVHGLAPQSRRDRLARALREANAVERRHTLRQQLVAGCDSGQHSGTASGRRQQGPHCVLTEMLLVQG